MLCKYCQSENVIKYGLYKDVQRYFCNDCKRKFVATDTIPKMQYPTHQISDALNMYYEGMSLNKIKEAKWEAEILFGDTAIQAIRDAVKSYGESYVDLSVAIEEYFDARLHEAKLGELIPDQDLLKELRDIIYQIPDDKFALKVNAATEKLSLAAKQYVR